MKDWIKTIAARLEEVWINVFWKNPNQLWALKVTGTIAFLLLPSLLLFEDTFIGTTMALGVVAMALGETDVHPKGRMKSAGIALFLFFITSSAVQLLSPYTVLFAGWTVIAAFILTLVGGFSSRMQGVTFGTLLIFVYTMLGADNVDKWFYQPLLYTVGAFAYSLVSVLLLYHKPYRMLQEQLARGFHHLAEYIQVKAGLFPSGPDAQVAIRTLLAQKNIALVQQVESCKNELYSYAEEAGADQPMVDYFYRTWFLLQEMQERAMSSHEKYDLLSKEVVNVSLLEGYGQLMKEVSKATHRFADSLLTGQPYSHPLSLSWTLSAVHKLLEEEKGQPHYETLSLLLKNLTGLEGNLRESLPSGVGVQEVSFHAYPTRERPALSTLLKPVHPRFRFAVRLSLAWLIGYGIMQWLEMEKGAWILLTSLIVFQQTYSATRMRLFHRIWGTLAGVVSGVVLAHLLPTLLGQVVLLLGSIYMFFYWLKKNYTVAAIFITVFVLASFNILSDEGIAVMLPRIIDTLIGATIAYLVVRFVWPDWQSKQLPRLLLLAVAKNRRYFESTYREDISDDVYFHNRRAAYRADNALAYAWKGMRLEPKRLRQYEDRAFHLTNLNHALLSYISAFGVHRYANLSDGERVICRQINGVLDDVCGLLTRNARSVSLQEQLLEAQRWEEQLQELEGDSHSSKVRLLYNFAHAARELLVEASEMANLMEKD